jgi:V/A-type H+-transporting ATPase subunit I
MSKVSVTGPKKHMRDVIEELHDAGVMDINDYEGELETGNPFEEGDQLSETLVEIRSVLSKLPERESDIETSIPLENLEKKVKEISRNLEEFRGKEDRLRSEKENLEDKKDFFRKLQGVELDYEDLDGTETVGAIITDVSRSKFESELNGESVEFYEGKDLNTVVYDRRDTEEVEAAIRRSGSDILSVPEIDYRGSIDSVVSKLESDVRELEEEKKNVESDIQNLADNNYVKLKNTEEFLTEKVEKAEAPLKFATTDHAFIIKGWVPTERFGNLNSRLDDLTKGKIHIQEEESSEEPPVKQKNNGLVAPRITD